ncbi:MAG: ABC transporter substrate-binding protein [Bacteroidetes bacterium]|nr:ABC transporter substrate-binding protein [Bacteroidota bacterium]
MQVVDQIGNKLFFKKIPTKIISLVPSISEYLWDLDLQKELVGITKFCIKPNKMFQAIQKIGGTKNVNFLAIEKIQPDLIIANKEENTKQDIEELQKKYTVYVSDINNFDEMYQMMNDVASITYKENEALKIISKIKLDLLHTKGAFNQLKIAYFIWQNPYMLAGNNTFINFIIEHLGLKNIAYQFNRYPELTHEQIIQLNPQILFLSTEPYPFTEKHIKNFNSIFKNSNAIIVDGEMFSWYGSRLLHLKNYIKQLAVQINKL